MEKLVELLNEFEKSIGFKPDWKVEGNGVAPRQSYYGTMISEMVVINKKTGFIKWLLCEEKIDTKYLDTVTVRDKIFKVEKRKSGEERLLMLLAISDTPIDDLISYLK